MAFGCRGEWSPRAGWRIAGGAAVAAALAMTSGTAFADVSIPPVVTPVGSLSAGIAGGLTVTAVAVPPVGLAPPLVVAVDSGAAQPVRVGTAPVAAAPAPAGPPPAPPAPARPRPARPAEPRRRRPRAAALAGRGRHRPGPAARSGPGAGGRAPARFRTGPGQHRLAAGGGPRGSGPVRGRRRAHLEARATPLKIALPSLRGAGPSWAGPTLLALGLALIVGWSATVAAGELVQRATDGRWQEVVGHGDPHAARVPPPPGLARPVDGIDFRLRVPRLGYQAVVREGVTPDVLFGGPGH